MCEVSEVGYQIMIIGESVSCLPENKLCTNLHSECTWWQLVRLLDAADRA